MLDQVAVGTEVVLGAVEDDDPARVRRLAELGLRPGAKVRVLRRTAGGGRVVAIGDDRVALARSVLAGIAVVADGDGAEAGATA